MSEKIKMSARALGLIGLLGGVGGAINAWLCYAKIPVPVGGKDDVFTFSWPIIPVGAVHGAVLALIGIGFSLLLWQRRRLYRWAVMPISGWISGWFAFVPITIYTFWAYSEVNLFGLATGTGRTLKRTDVFEALAWPLKWDIDALTSPFLTFGFVGLMYYFLLNICRQLTARRFALHVLLGSVSGILGSLWWWIACKPWYFSLIHGTIWGSLVSFGVWKAQQAPRNLVDEVHHL